MCTEENSDSSDEEDLQDESMDQTSAEVEDPTLTQDTTTKQSARGKVKRKEYQWKKKKFEPPDVEFDECVEEDSEDRLDWTPYMYFKDLVTDETNKPVQCAEICICTFVGTLSQWQCMELLLAPLSQVQKRAKSSVADHDPLQKQ